MTRTSFQSDIRFYTSLGEKALLEGQGQKGGHESRADSAYFTISFGDQDITNTEYGSLLHTHVGLGWSHRFFIIRLTPAMQHYFIKYCTCRKKTT